MTVLQLILTLFRGKEREGESGPLRPPLKYATGIICSMKMDVRAFIPLLNQPTVPEEIQKDTRNRSNVNTTIY